MLELRRSLVGLLVFYAATIAITGCAPAPPAFKSLDIGSVDWGKDFELTAHTGERVSTATFRGKVLVMFFGYTHCPDICAPTLSKLAQVNKRLGEDAGRVQVLFVTVDPEHDTVEQLAGFVPKFDPSFIGFTGTDQEIAAVAEEYKIGYQKTPNSTASQTQIVHSGGLMVKDAGGKLRLLIKNHATVDEIEHDVILLLSEKG
jgi:protein SCO1